MKVALALAAAAALLSGGSAGAQEQMSLEELDAARGGLMTPWGVEIGFGAVVRTYVDGELALQSRLTWTPTGPKTSYDVGAPTEDLATAAGAYGLKVAPGAAGLLSPGEGGATVVLHDLGDDYLGGLVLNTASNRDIRQSTEVTLNLPSLPALQGQIAARALGNRLQDALGLALRDAAIR